MEQLSINLIDSRLVYSIGMASKFLGKSRTTISAMVKRGELQARLKRRGNHQVPAIKGSELLRWLTEFDEPQYYYNTIK